MKWLGVGFAMFLALTLFPQSAGELVHYQAPYIEEVDGADSNTPFKVQYIDLDKYQGVNAYENTFTTMPEQGSKLTVKVHNKNSTSHVMLKVYRGTEEFGYADVKARTEGTRTFAMHDGRGVTGDWKVYITSRDGQIMNLQIRAGQHD
ncbi:hypothetical protein JNUCC32_07765 [Paenibacillus sp. JNUCC32]|uniref:hypothetical protein n=1 Tax=Paenibacillus sp. JNUCC32 TaxID=2777984 RepID=UPI001787FD81|nr:hypothetical protein [Paenibacillus sp. JNUCC-32]QOT11912.1 hypothetical protein JNUCC32_07765 [Paenibacillus sp. JNUCC-32]